MFVQAHTEEPPVNVSPSTGLGKTKEIMDWLMAEWREGLDSFEFASSDERNKWCEQYQYLDYTEYMRIIEVGIRVTNIEIRQSDSRAYYKEDPSVFKQLAPLSKLNLKILTPKGLEILDAFESVHRASGALRKSVALMKVGTHVRMKPGEEMSRPRAYKTGVIVGHERAKGCKWPFVVVKWDGMKKTSRPLPLNCLEAFTPH